MLREHTPKLCFPGFELNYESIDKNNKIYDTLKIVFESTHFRKKKILFRSVFQFGGFKSRVSAKKVMVYVPLSGLWQ